MCYTEVSQRSTSNFTFKMYLSQNNTFDQDDVFLGEKVTRALAGYAKLCNYLDSPTIPNSNWPSGKIYVIGIIDVNNVIAETNENNNMIIRQVNYTNTGVTATTDPFQQKK